MLKELCGNILIDLVVPRQFEGDAHEVESIHRHPRSAVSLVNEAARGQRRAAVEHTNVVESKEAALKNVPTLRVLAIHPPGEVQHQLVKNPFEEGEVALVTALLAVHLEHAPCRPGVNGRVDIAERPF